MKNIVSQFAAATVLLCCLSIPVSPSVIGIDYGTEWFKVAIVKHGIPLDIVLNKESLRKTHSLLTFKGEERLFGADAYLVATRYPESTFPAVKNVLGRLFDDEQSAIYRRFYSNRMTKHPERGTASFQLGTDGTQIISAEEVLAQQLIHAKQQAEKAGNEPVSGAIITIPPFFNQFERQAILDAAELANLRILSLIHDETAVALNYAMNRVFSTTPQHHIFFDMGAGSTVASLVTFTGEEVKDKFGKLTQSVSLEVSAVGYDRTLGGHEFDYRLQQHFAKAFMESKGSKLEIPIFENKKAMSKLLKEAAKVKTILSANNDTIASVESLHEDHDFRVKVTRAEFEEMSADLFERISQPIKNVISASGLELKNITSVVLVGGGVRIPKIQHTLKELLGDDLLAKNVNGDEAAVLGAALRAAGLTPKFRVKEFKIKDISLFSIGTEHLSENKSSNGNFKTIKTKLYPENSAIDVEKYLVFKRSADFDFSVKYSDIKDSPKELFDVTVKGVEDAVAAKNGTFTAPPQIKVSVGLSSSGMVSVKSAKITFKVEDKSADPSLTEKLLNFVGMGKDSKEEGEASEAQPQEPKPEEAASSDDESGKDTAEKEPPVATNATESAEDKNATSTAETKPEAPKIKSEDVTLKVVTVNKGIVPLTAEEKRKSLERFNEWAEADTQRRSLEEARNSLESYAYSSTDFLDKSNVPQVTTEEERKVLSEKSSALVEWIYDSSDSHAIEDYKTRLSELKTLREPIELRLEEFGSRPQAFTQMHKAVAEAYAYIEKKKAIPDEDKVVTVDELEKFRKVVEEVEKWGKEKEEEQAKTDLWKEPVVKTKEIRKRFLPFIATMKIFDSRPPKPQPKKEEKKEEKKPQEAGGEEKSAESKDESKQTTSEDKEQPAQEKEHVPEPESYTKPGSTQHDDQKDKIADEKTSEKPTQGEHADDKQEL